MSYVYPSNGLKGFEQSKYAKELLDPKLKLTDAEKDRLQQEIDDLFATEKLVDQLP